MIENWLEVTTDEVRKLFSDDCSGHDYYHTLRVYKTACTIAGQEPCDSTVVCLAALLHDTDDVKLFQTSDYANARRILQRIDAGSRITEAVIQCISEVSFKGKDTVRPTTKEGCIVQDADRLDAIGAIGIARTFAYGGSHNRVLYEPDEQPLTGMDEQTYRNHIGCTLNHFYEKLLLLKDLMNTDTAKQIASHRHQYMEQYLREFLDEWEGIR
ncbi:MAG: HD domain-containing protein [Erysipelotrichaceae bacterium]|nr:HD domain-containing protein [Erysipelotrichaceae bacterium]